MDGGKQKMDSIYMQLQRVIEEMKTAYDDELYELPHLAVVFTQAVLSHFIKCPVVLECRVSVSGSCDVSPVYAFHAPTKDSLNQESIHIIHQSIKLIQSSLTECKHDSIQKLLDFIDLRRAVDLEDVSREEEQTVVLLDNDASSSNVKETETVEDTHLNDESSFMVVEDQMLEDAVGSTMIASISESIVETSPDVTLENPLEIEVLNITSTVDMIDAVSEKQELTPGKRKVVEQNMVSRLHSYSKKNEKESSPKKRKIMNNGSSKDEATSVSESVVVLEEESGSMGSNDDSGHSNLGNAGKRDRDTAEHKDDDQDLDDSVITPSPSPKKSGSSLFPKCPICGMLVVDHTSTQQLQKFEAVLFQHIAKQHKSFCDSYATPYMSTSTIAKNKGIAGLKNADKPDNENVSIVSEKSLTCMYCELLAGKVACFGTKLSLRRHIQEQHVQATTTGGHVCSLDCPLCDKQYHSVVVDKTKDLVFRMSGHMEEAHGFTLGTTLTLQPPNFTPLDTRPMQSTIVSPLTSATFVGNQPGLKLMPNVTLDKTVHGAPPFICKYCEAQFGRQVPFQLQSELRTHIQDQHLVKKGKDWQLSCPLCKKSYVSSDKTNLRTLFWRISKHMEEVHKATLGVIRANKEVPIAPKKAAPSLPYIPVAVPVAMSPGGLQVVGKPTLPMTIIANNQVLQPSIVGAQRGTPIPASNPIAPLNVPANAPLQDIVHTCLYCNEKEFSTQQELRAHLTAKHVVNKNNVFILTCPMCEKTYSAVKTRNLFFRMKRHMEDVHKTSMDVTREASLPLTSSVMVSSVAPIIIMPSQTNVTIKEAQKLGTLPCFYCQNVGLLQNFRFAVSLRQHITEKHMYITEKEQTLPCPLCYKEFKSNSMALRNVVFRMFKHVEEIHNVAWGSTALASTCVKLGEISAASLKFAQNLVIPAASNTASALTSVSNGSRPGEQAEVGKFYCVECVLDQHEDLKIDKHPEPFPTRAALSDHLSTTHMISDKDSNKVRMTCPVCTKQFQKGGINFYLRHLRILHGVVYDNEESVIKFVTNWKANSDKEPVLKIEDIEAASAPNSDDENDTSAETMLNNAWVCLMCDNRQRFNTQPLLKEHIISTHINNNEFKCTLCSWQPQNQTGLDADYLAGNYILHCTFSHQLLQGTVLSGHGIGSDSEKQLLGDKSEKVKIKSEHQPGKETNSDESEEPSKRYCFICNDVEVTFDSEDSFVTHLRTEHVEIIDERESCLGCSMCNFRLIRASYIMQAPGPPEVVEQLMLMHMVQKHGITVPESAPKYLCTSCGWETLVSAKFVAHLRNMHKITPANLMVRFRLIAVDTVVCADCGKSMKSASIRAHGKWCQALQRKTERFRRFQCKECTKTYLSKYQLRQHIASVHRKEKNMLCAICGTGCLNEQKLKRHTWTKHKENLTYDDGLPCMLCGILVPRSFVAIHRLEHRAQRSVHQCHICNRTIKSVSNYRKHLATHAQIGDGQTKCQICDKTISSGRRNKSVLAFHMARCHQINSYQCLLCKFITTTAEKLEQHKKDKHPDGQLINFCLICKKHFLCQADYHNHMYVRHKVNLSDRPVLSCDICGFTTLGLSLMRAHKQNHNELSHRCDICTRLFRTKARLTAHVNRSHSQKNYRCSKCDFTTRTQRLLLRHDTRVHWKSVYKCDFCTFTTNALSLFKSHMRKLHGVGKEEEEVLLTALLSQKPAELIQGKSMDVVDILSENTTAAGAEDTVAATEISVTTAGMDAAPVTTAEVEPFDAANIQVIPINDIDESVIMEAVDGESLGIEGDDVQYIYIKTDG